MSRIEMFSVGQEVQSIPETVRQNVLWSRKQSFDATSLSKSEIYKNLDRGSASVVGLPDYGISRMVTVEFPRVSANTDETRVLVNEAALAVYKKEVKKAFAAGQINEEERDENLIVATSPSGLKKHPIAGTPSRPMGIPGPSSTDVIKGFGGALPAAKVETRISGKKKGVMVIGGVAMVLASCAPVRGVVVVQPPQSEPVPVHSTSSGQVTETFTPDVSLTPEVTPTIDQEQHEPGTAYISPEFDLNDQIEIIPENAQAFHDYFLAALMRVNPVEAAALKTADGQTVFDVNAPDTENVARFRTYLTENNWLTPAGWRINSGGGRLAGGNYTQLNEADRPLNVRNLGIEFIDYQQYQEMTVYPNIKLDISYLFDVNVGFTRAGFKLVEEGDSYAVAVQIVDFTGRRESRGFPQGGEPLTPTETEWLDQYATFVLYTFRAFSVNPPEELQTEWPRGNTTWGHVAEIDDYGVGSYISGTYRFFNEYKDGPSDAPVSILQVQ